MSRIRFGGISPFSFLSEALNRDLKLICVSNFVGAFGEGLYFYLWPLYIRTLGGDPVEIGTVFSVLYLVSALTPIPGGLLADRYDRRKIVLFAWLIWAFTPLAYSLAEHWSQLLPGAILWGASMIGAPAITAYVATSAPKEKMASVFSIVSATWTFGYVFSPALGGYLSTIFGVRWVLRLSFILSILCVSMYLFVGSQYGTAESPQRSSRLSMPPYARKMITWTLFFASTMFVTVLARPYVPTFLQDEVHLDDFQIGVMGSVTFLGSALLGIWLGRIGDRWKKAGAVSISMVLYVASILILVSFKNLTALFVAAFLMGGSYISGSLVSSVVGLIVPEATRGRWMSVPQAVGMLAAFFAPYLGGLLYNISIYHPFMVAILATPLLVAIALAKPLEEGM